MASKKGPLIGSAASTASAGLFGAAESSENQLLAPKLFTPVPPSNMASSQTTSSSSHHFPQFHPIPLNQPLRQNDGFSAPLPNNQASTFLQPVSMYASSIPTGAPLAVSVSNQKQPALIAPLVQGSSLPSAVSQSYPDPIRIDGQSSMYSPRFASKVPDQALLQERPVQSFNTARAELLPSTSTSAKSEQLPGQSSVPDFQRPMSAVSPQLKASSSAENVIYDVTAPSSHANSSSLQFPPRPPPVAGQYKSNVNPYSRSAQQSARPTNVAINPALAVHTQPVVHHWFFLSGNQAWVPFSYLDSYILEHAYLNGQKQVSTDGGRHDVSLQNFIRTPVYWNGASTEVRRCSWFYKGDGESKLIPYGVDVAEKLETAYVGMMSKGIYNVRVDIGASEFVIFHNPNVIVHYHSNSENMDWTGEDAKVRPKVVRRGISDMQEDIEEGEPLQVDHLVFVVHGIGPVADLRFRSIVECVDDFRRQSLRMVASHKLRADGSPTGRVEFLPVQWYSNLHNDKMGIDRQLKQLSLPSIGKLRDFTNDTLTDILFFASPLYCQTICDTVVNEMNRIYSLFMQRNPHFGGRISAVGHSLGSCILFDILANQSGQTTVAETTEDSYEDVGDVDCEIDAEDHLPAAPSVASLPFAQSEAKPKTAYPPVQEILKALGLLSLEKKFAEEQMDTDTLTMCSENDLRDLGVQLGPRKKLLTFVKEMQKQPTSTSSVADTVENKQGNPSAPLLKRAVTRGTQTPVKLSLACNSTGRDCQYSYKQGLSGTGQPSVKYKELHFETSCLFCIGSPLGLFLTCRGVSSIGPDFYLPKCPSFMNIFHPFDPVVYRLEPLIDAQLTIPPVLIPHHKGRKRFHLELKENLTRVGANLKQGIIEVVSRTWTSINDFARAHRSQGDAGGLDPGIKDVSDLSDTASSVGDPEEVLDPLLNFGRLNGGKRIDYVLQEKPFEILNEYLFALSSHSCYWTSEDTALLVLRQIYNCE